MRYFESFPLVKNFIELNLLNKDLSVTNNFFGAKIVLYMKDSGKKYTDIEDIISELKDNGFLFEIIEYKGHFNTLFEPKGYVLLYSQLMKCLSHDGEYLTNDMNAYKLLTINQVCDFLSVSRPTVYRLIEEKEIPAFEILGQKRIQFSELLRYVRDNTLK